jgi:prophage tail gpP-like protein
MSGTASAVTVIAGGTAYTGWSEVSVSRGLDRCASHVEVTVTERLLGQPAIVPLAPYTPIVVKYGTETVLSGFVDQYNAEFDADGHGARIVGRSKTGQLIDCMPDIKAGQFLGYSLAAIAKSLGAIFNVSVIVQTTLADAPVADATMERCETAFRFLDRLCAVAGVLPCDDETGALVLTTAGTARASGTLVQGKTIMRGRFMANGERRFSQYIVKGQRGIAAAAGASGFVTKGTSGFAPGPDGSVTIGQSQATPHVGVVLTQQRAVALDAKVPLYRPHVTMAESQLDQAQIQLRANWQRSYAYGHSLKAVITVVGWVQPDGTLWQINNLVTVTSSFLGLDEDVLILALDFRFSLDDGHTTDITVGPIEGAMPSPNLLNSHVHVKKAANLQSTGPVWRRDEPQWCDLIHDHAR